MLFERSKYYNQTDVYKKYKVSLKVLKSLLQPLKVISREVDLGTYSVTAYYYLKQDIEDLHLPLR
jgi:hypothetical protein